MIDTKSWSSSTGVWGGIVAALAGAAGLFGYTITPSDQAALASSISQIFELATSACALVGGLVAVYGRIRASKLIAPKQTAA